MTKHKFSALLIAAITVICLFSSCSDNNENRVINVIGEASAVYVNGIENNTVEAALGAFEGKQGDYIEFKFSEPQAFNTLYITEKTASVRQFNIYAEIDGKYTLVYTGKHILQDNIIIDTVTATGIKFEVVNTEIGNDSFLIQGINAYNTKGE